MGGGGEHGGTDLYNRLQTQLITKIKVMQIAHHIEHPAMLATGRRDQKCNHLMMVMTAAQPSVSQTHHPDGLLPRMLLLTLTLTIKIFVTFKIIEEVVIIATEFFGSEGLHLDSRNLTLYCCR